MAEQNQPGSAAQSHQKSRPKAKLAPIVRQTSAEIELAPLPAEPIGAEAADGRNGLAPLLWGAEGAFGGGSMETQVARLGDPRLQTVQRQALAAQIGRMQGNRHLQRVMASLKSAEVSFNVISQDRDNSHIQRQPLVGVRSLPRTPATPISRLGEDTLRGFSERLRNHDAAGALGVIAQAMEQRGEIDSRLMVTQAVPRHPNSDCQGTDPYILNPDVNGANTISCGCFSPSGSGNRLPNPRIRINFGSLQTRAVTRTTREGSFEQFLAEILHSTLLHEFRHVRQEYEMCNASGTQRESGVCTDCNNPGEMDAYLTEIEAGYNPAVYRGAWVRVYVNWDYLSPNQQAVFQTRKNAAEQRIQQAFPGVNWAEDPEVARYRSWCQERDREAGGNTRGRCDSPLAPRAATSGSESPQSSATCGTFTEACLPWWDLY